MLHLSGRSEEWADLAVEVRRAISRKIDDPDTVEDLVQDVFVRVASRQEQLRDGERLAAWVGRIARSIVVDHYRRTRPAEPLPESVAEETPDDVVETAPLARFVGRKIESLPEHYRDVLRLTEIEGITQREAAERLGVSLSALKSRVLRGRAMLEEELHECCTIELDRRGGVVDYSPRKGCC